MSKPNEWVLWGQHPAYAGGIPIKLSGGNLRKCRSDKRQRERDGGWVALVIRRPGQPMHFGTEGGAA